MHSVVVRNWEAGTHRQDEEAAKGWAADVASALAGAAQRPRALLALLNPWGGSGRAHAAWELQAFPVLSAAGAPPCSKGGL